MIKAASHRVIIPAVAACLLFSFSTGHATNGYWQHGFGAKSKGMAGAGTALPLDGMDAGSNPATMVYLGNRTDLGIGLFSPDRGHTARNDGAPDFPTITPGHHESTNRLFFLPHFAWNRMINKASSVGVSIGANSGMNTEYDAAVFSAFDNPGGKASAPTGIDFSQIFLGITYARKISENHAFGVTPILAAQTVEVRGLEPFKPFSASPDNLTNNGHDYAYGGGFKIGWVSRFQESLSLGFYYQTRLFMTKFHDYKGLFADEGDFDIPPVLSLGLAWKATEALTFILDIQQIRFEAVGAISNRSDRVLNPGAIILGTAGGLGFGWDNMTVGKFGIQWDFRPDLTLRAGYSIGNQVIPHDQTLFNILAPGVITEHFTLGMTKRFRKKHELSIAIMYAPFEKIHGCNPNTGPQTESIEMDQVEFEVSWGRRF